MAFELPPLPYDQGALAPHLSAETFEYHYGKHHQAYVTKLNELTDDNKDGKSLEEVIKGADGPLFNNAAQVWNHTFYWSCMSPDGGGEPKGALADAISSSFGSVDRFKEKFSTSAVGNFGSGWTWIVKDGDGLAILNTDDADTPIAHDQTPVLTIDVWEHAYYIDYRNARPKYVETFLDKLINWDFAASNL